VTIEYIRYEIPEGQRAAFIAAYAAAKGPLMASPYSRGFDLCQCA